MMNKCMVLGSVFAFCAAAVSADVYSNGPLVTHPGGGAGGKDASAGQTAIGLTILGFGMSDAVGYRLADDFIVPPGQVYTVTALEFFAYQVGGNTTSPTIKSFNLGVWSKMPDGKPGTGDVLPNTTFPVNASNCQWTDMYRVFESSMQGTNRPVWKITITLPSPLRLHEGVYWLDWSASGTLPAGPYAPPVTILGKLSKPQSNAMQFVPILSNGTDDWVALEDSGPQDLPFILILSDCDADCDSDAALTINDFICFQTFFAIGELRADCDGSGSLTIDDFFCFQTLFVLGC